jgi:hypothetical protein
MYDIFKVDVRPGRTKMAAIYTLEGNELSAGLQGCNVCDEAIQAAKRFAQQLGTDVHLVDDDGEWIVHPTDEAADPA